MLENIITSFVISGGIGFINYFILSGIGVLNVKKRNKEDKALFLLLFTIVNLSLFSFVTYRLNLLEWNDTLIFALSIIVTTILTIVFSFSIFKWTINGSYSLINKCRIKDLKGEVSNRSVRELVIDSSVPLYGYMYDLKDNTLLAYGAISWNNEDEDDSFEISFWVCEQLDRLEFESAISMAKKNVDSSIYVNVDKNIKIVIVPVPSE